MDRDGRRRWRVLQAQITQVVNEIDPMDFLAAGAPADEYETQAAQILSAYLRTGPDVEALTRAIQDTFDRWFGVGPASIPRARSRLMATRLCAVLPTVDGDHAPDVGGRK